MNANTVTRVLEVLKQNIGIEHWLILATIQLRRHLSEEDIWPQLWPNLFLRQEDSGSRLFGERQATHFVALSHWLVGHSQDVHKGLIVLLCLYKLLSVKNECVQALLSMRITRKSSWNVWQYQAKFANEPGLSTQ